MSKLKAKAEKAIAEGTKMSSLVSEECRDLQGRDGGSQVLKKSTRGGADGGAGGYEGQILQLPWSEKVVEMLCRRHDGVGNGPEWAGIVCEDLSGGYLVEISVRRLSESYMIKDENGDDRKIATNFDSNDPAPSHFKGGNDWQGLLNFLEHVNGRSLRINKIKTIQRTVNGQSFNQKIWDYTILDEVEEDSLIWSLENWDKLTTDQKKVAAGAASAAGADTKTLNNKN